MNELNYHDQYFPDDDDEPIDDNSICHGCPNNTPQLCPYENDGNGKCPMRDLAKGN